MNGSYRNLQKAESRNQETPFAIQLPDWSFTAGDVVELPLRIPTTTSLHGLQFVLQFSNLEILAVEEGKISAAQFHLDRNNELKVCWDHLTGHKQENDLLISIKVKASKGGKLSNFLSINANQYPSLAVDASNKIAPVSLSFNSSKGAIYNSPNPFQYETTIVYQLEATESVVLNVYNVEGQLLYNTSLKGYKGQNQVILTKELLQASGLLFYEVRTKDRVFSNKMLLR